MRAVLVNSARKFSAQMAKRTLRILTVNTRKCRDRDVEDARDAREQVGKKFDPLCDRTGRANPASSLLHASMLCGR